MLFLSVIIASVVDRVVVFFKRFQVPRAITVIIFYLISLSVIFILFYFFLPRIIDYVGTTIKMIPNFLNSLDSLKYSSINFFNSNKMTSFSAYANSLNTNQLVSLAQDKILNASGLIAGTSSFINFLVNFILTLVISFYISINERGVHNFLRLISPRKYENYIESLVERSERKISNWFIGQIIYAFCVGLLIYITLLILKIPFALPIALVTCIGETMPMVGIFSGSILSLFFAYNVGGMSLMIITLISILVISQICSYVIFPKIVGKLAGIPTIMTIVSIIMGAILAGFWGALIAIPVSAIVMEILDDYKKRKEDEQFILY
jgi:predicted PurR-regulated permease PerM